MVGREKQRREREIEREYEGKRRISRMELFRF